MRVLAISFFSLVAAQVAVNPSLSLDGAALDTGSAQIPAITVEPMGSDYLQTALLNVAPTSQLDALSESRLIRVASSSSSSLAASAINSAKFDGTPSWLSVPSDVQSSSSQRATVNILVLAGLLIFIQAL